MLLIHGLNDETVAVENAKKLQNAVKNKGGRVMLVTYEDVNHAETVGSLMWFWRYKTDIQEKMITFFKEHRR
jgi:dipeptidyl aminopeptidase/acylaminoacyl peptidase